MFGKVSKVRPGRAGPIRALDPTRVVEDVFCLDFRGPIAPLEAFAIAPAAYRALTWADCLLAFSDKVSGRPGSVVAVRIAAGQLPWRRSEL